MFTLSDTASPTSVQHRRSSLFSTEALLLNRNERSAHATVIQKTPPSGNQKPASSAASSVDEHVDVCTGTPSLNL